MSSVVDHEKTQSGSLLSGVTELRELPEWFREQQRAAWDQF